MTPNIVENHCTQNKAILPHNLIKSLRVSSIFRLVDYITHLKAKNYFKDLINRSNVARSLN